MAARIDSVQGFLLRSNTASEVEGGCAESG
jgi:hypothetical protein